VNSEEKPHLRRKRYSGKHPRHYADKYKEHDPLKYAETVEKVLASGKTPAGQHVPIMVSEVLSALKLRDGARVVDCTLGYGGHARAFLRAIAPEGVLLGLDQDPVEIAKTEARLRAAGFDEMKFPVRRRNFAGVQGALHEVGWSDGADAIFADLGLSSMQIDNPERGFSFKLDGPLDMRMNPQRGLTAAAWLAKVSMETLALCLQENSDEPHAVVLAQNLAGKSFRTTQELKRAVLEALPTKVKDEEEREASVRRVFQAIRIEVNDEFGVLDQWLKALPQCLRPGGRVAVLTFHSGEDRRVKKAFQAGIRAGMYTNMNDEVIRAGAEERQRNPRASSAKLRWAFKAEA
jgi:16S rRNA (cytosine1402-N4)-methyltransferase